MLLQILFQTLFFRVNVSHKNFNLFNFNQIQSTCLERVTTKKKKNKKKKGIKESNDILIVNWSPKKKLTDF